MCYLFLLTIIAFICLIYWYNMLHEEIHIIAHWEGFQQLSWILPCSSQSCGAADPVHCMYDKCVSDTYPFLKWMHLDFDYHCDELCTSVGKVRNSFIAKITEQKILTVTDTFCIFQATVRVDIALCFISVFSNNDR